jgi:predicted RNase H-like HicB family nuclease
MTPSMHGIVGIDRLQPTTWARGRIVDTAARTRRLENMKLKLTTRYSQYPYTDTRWTAYFAELPEVVGVGNTKADALAVLSAEALKALGADWLERYEIVGR